MLSERESRFLAGARVGRLATADAVGRPHAVPVVFACRGDSIYVPIDAKPKGDPLRLRRVRNIRENPRVVLLVDHYEEDWSRLGFLLVRGRASLLEGAGAGGERGEAEDLLRAKYPQFGKLAVSAGPGLMIRIEVEGRAAWGRLGEEAGAV
ncbi:MAG: TIGR03668 family PPOX class F420-dependent oxidoreductase [Candidatus Tectomicrobia bacterium]|nr:TIGR03668 family PPOX class F420-dependent oxidoreductase [Candidatus Tectomicrobia bacterium]